MVDGVQDGDGTGGRDDDQSREGSQPMSGESLVILCWNVESGAGT